ncbi:MAG: hypothetical protein ACI8W3_001735 [Myxococcota bacterium]
MNRPNGNSNSDLVGLNVVHAATFDAAHEHYSEGLTTVDEYSWSISLELAFVS